MTERKVNLMIARFPYGNAENPDVTDWFAKTMHEAKGDPRIERVRYMRHNDTPITMTRNLACKQSRDLGCTHLLMVDSDMLPDESCTGGNTFFKSSLDFMLRHEGPCVVAAPYCGPPPDSPPYVFRWTTGINMVEQNDAMWTLQMYGREEASLWRGIVEVAAAATGVILIDLEALQSIEPPWFAYEYADKYEAEKVTTEDVYFTRNLSLHKVPVYCNFDTWAGHWKRFLVRRPVPLMVNDIRDDLVRRIQHGYRKGQILEQVYVNDGEIKRGLDANPRIRREEASEVTINGSSAKAAGTAGCPAGRSARDEGGADAGCAQHLSDRSGGLAGAGNPLGDSDDRAEGYRAPD